MISINTGMFELVDTNNRQHAYTPHVYSNVIYCLSNEISMPLCHVTVQWKDKISHSFNNDHTRSTSYFKVIWPIIFIMVNEIVGYGCKCKQPSYRLICWVKQPQTRRYNIRWRQNVSVEGAGMHLGAGNIHLLIFLNS